MNIADRAPKLEVNQRLPLRHYYRIADSILRQARIYRGERNVIDLYILLLRYASLATDTIPRHNEYKRLPDVQRTLLRKNLFEAVSELERLKPVVQTEWMKTRSSLDHSASNENHQFVRYDPAENDVALTYNRVQDQNKWQGNLAVSLTRPRDETVSRHSYFNIQPVKTRAELFDSSSKVKYPSQIDFSLVEMPSLEQNSFQKPASQLLDSSSLLSPSSPYDLVNQLAPPPVPVPVQTLPHAVADPRPGPPQSELKEGPKHLHVSTRLMEEFLALARFNTQKNLETCGVLAGVLEKGLFSVTTLIVPKQEATSDSCQTLNEEELFEVQDRRNLFQLGWIHTHPTQTCFMSSIDLHTHYSYQVMLREAIAIVVAPTDEERSFGIFRLSEPEGMKTIQQCDQRGFHPHDEPEEGGSIYGHCSHVYMNPGLKFDIVDLR